MVVRSARSSWQLEWEGGSYDEDWVVILQCRLDVPRQHGCDQLRSDDHTTNRHSPDQYSYSLVVLVMRIIITMMMIIDLGIVIIITIVVVVVAMRVIWM
jgi:hypothetical protein